MHILIFEDGPVVANVLGMTLEEAGHFLSIAHTIEVALAELRHNDIDAVLLDINLPRWRWNKAGAVDPQKPPSGADPCGFRQCRH